MDKAATAEKTSESPVVYDPNRLLDTMLNRLKIKNDAALARILEVTPPVISKIRHHKLPVGAALLIRMNEITDLSIRELRDIMGDRRKKFRISNVHHTGLERMND